MAMEAGEIGVWEWYLKPTPESGVLIWDNRMHKLFGTKPETWTGKYSGFAECLTPETLMITEAKIRAAIEHGIPYDYVFQLRLENGASWIHGKGKLYYGKRGEPERFVGVCLRTVFGNQVTHLLKQYEI